LKFDAGGEAIRRGRAFVIAGEGGVIFAYDGDAFEQALAVETGRDAEAAAKPFLVAVVPDDQRRRNYLQHRFAFYREAIEKILAAGLRFGQTVAEEFDAYLRRDEPPVAPGVACADLVFFLE